ncbi:MAG: TolC family protein [Myxococcota bacterium]
MLPKLLLAITAGLTADSATVALTYDDAVDLALRIAPSVRSARVSRDQAALTTLRANLDRFSLRVDAQVQEIWAKTNIGVSDPGFEGFLGLSNLSARLDVPVFSGFRVEANVARSEHLERAARQTIAAEQRAIKLAVGRAYWSARKLGLLSETTRQAIMRLQRAENATRARVDAGLAPPLDVNRAVARRRRQQAELVDARGQQREVEAQLAVLLGVDAPIALVDAPRFQRSVPDRKTSLDDARKTRPELRQIDHQIEAQDESVRIAMSDYYPQLGVFGLFQYGNNPSLAGAGNRAVFASANPFGNLVGDIQLGVTASVNIFDTMNTWTSVKQARIERDRLTQERARIQQQVDTDVRTAHAKLRRLIRLIDGLDEARNIALDNVQITEARYQDGDALVLELLEAQLELFDIERQRTDAVVELMTARVEFDAAIGRPQRDL